MLESAATPARAKQHGGVRLLQSAATPARAQQHGGVGFYRAPRQPGQKNSAAACASAECHHAHTTTTGATARRRALLPSAFFVQRRRVLSILNSVSLAGKTLSKKNRCFVLFFCFLSNFLSRVLLEKGLGRRRPCGYGFGSWTGRTRGQPRNPLRRWKRGAGRLFGVKGGEATALCRRPALQENGPPFFTFSCLSGLI